MGDPAGEEGSDLRAAQDGVHFACQGHSVKPGGWTTVPGWKLRHPGEPETLGLGGAFRQGCWGLELVVSQTWVLLSGLTPFLPSSACWAWIWPLKGLLQGKAGTESPPPRAVGPLKAHPFGFFSSVFIDTRVGQRPGTPLRWAKRVVSFTV